MTLSAVEKLSDAQFTAQLLQFLKIWENAPLIGDNHTRDGAIHNDGVNIPTVGYGINLLALSADQVSTAFTYALTGSTSGSLTSSQKTGIAIVKQWRQYASTSTTSDNLALIAKSRAEAGSSAEKSALESIWLSDVQASRLLEAKLFGVSGLFDTSIESQIAARLAYYGATMPENSAEKLVLFSLYYNAPGLIGPGISAAIADNDHARFWYEIRYNHANTGFRGVQNRREDESDKVGILAQEDRDKVHKILKAFDTLFGTESDATGIYDKILVRDATIKATDPSEYATESFTAQIAPYIATLSAKLAHGRDIDFVQTGTSGRDRLSPGEGKHADIPQARTADLMVGQRGSDTLSGGGGRDTLLGGKGADLLRGGSGGDRLEGGKGNDTLIGGRGFDILAGQQGEDRFVFAPNNSNNRILKFTPGEDLIDLSRFNFSSLAEALSHFSDGSRSSVIFDHDGTRITIKGPHANDFGAGDLMI